MNAEIVAVGNELLSGETVNSNAATIGQALSSAGVACTRTTVVGDEPGAIASAVRDALARAEAVVVCGGLGPTEDDVTREALAAALDRPLRRDEALVRALRERFASFGRTMPERNLTQADVLEGATIIEPDWGTAPGMIVPAGDRVVYALPGVPDELADMLERGVVPDVQRRAGAGRIASRTLHVVGVPESQLAEALRDVFAGLDAGVAMAYLPARGEVRVRVTARGDDDATALAAIAPVVAAVEAIVGDSIVGSDADDLDAVVAARLRERGWRLAAGESLTGGAFGARCTDRGGSSEWFAGGVVAYDAAGKASLLGVDPSIIEDAGVVSVEVAEAMADGARRAFGAEVGVGLTGVAGPSEHGKAVGTVCLAVVTPSARERREVRLPGDRRRVRELAVTSALIVLARTLASPSP